MKTILLFAVAVLFATQSFAQTFEVPAGYKFETKDDYTKYEQDVIGGINWLSSTPINQEQAKRKDVNAFLMKWMSGSPTVSIEVSQKIVTFTDCPQCLMAFLGGWTKYSLETGDNKNKVKGNLAGVEGVIQFYKLNKATLGKNKAIEKYIKLQEKGRLEEHIKSRV